MRRLLIILTALLGSAVAMRAQDIHFTQYYVSPFNLNPSYIGHFDGDYRAMAQYRTQWRSVTVPFNTFSAAGDASQPFPVKKLGAGASLYRDRTGDSRFTTTHALLGASYSFPLVTDSTQQIRVGWMTGVSHMGLDYSDLNYDSQFSGGIFNPGIDPGEDFNRSQRSWWSNHIGVSYHWQRASGEKYDGGISFFNVTAPKQSLFDDLGVRLDTRVQLNAAANIPINETWDVLPSTVIRLQGTAREWILGGRARYTLVDIADQYKAVYGGMYWRTRDAGNVIVGLDVNQWQFGASYDFNLSQLREASNGRGGLELSVVYIWKLFKPSIIRHRICPEYI